MNCQNCGTALSGNQTTACSKPCRIKLDGIKRRESGRLRKANMHPASYEKKQIANRDWQSKLADRQCIICKETQQVRISHSRTRPICIKCAVWAKGYTPSPSKDLLFSPPKKQHPSTTPPTVVIKGGWWTAGNCIICEQSFVSPYTAKTCSDKCQRKHKRDTNRWIAMSRRQAIYERDEWICQICLEPVDRTLVYHAGVYEPGLASLDHILPRSLGGSDDDSNLRLAHWLCNSLRGAAIE